MVSPLFFFNDTATTEIYTLSLHDALPISARPSPAAARRSFTRSVRSQVKCCPSARSEEPRLNSSHSQISYAVFCLKKKTDENASHFINTASTTRPPVVAAFILYARAEDIA